MDAEFLSTIVERLCELQDAVQGIDLVNRECLVGLLCTLERLSQQTFIDGALLTAVLSSLPFNRRPGLNNDMYKWLMWKLESCQDSECEFVILRLLTLPFVRDSFEMRINPSLIGEIAKLIGPKFSVIQEHQSDFFSNESDAARFADQFSRLSR